MRVKDAFTMIEIIVVLIIVGILAAMALPNFTLSLRRSHARDAINNLLAIHSAQQIYKENSSGNVYLAAVNTAALNNVSSGLGLNITPSSVGDVYSCTVGGVCSVVADTFTLTLNLTSPLTTTHPVYCTNTVPDATYNPCCDKTVGGGTTGSACP